MLSQDSEDEIRSRFVFELAIWLWQDELNPLVRNLLVLVPVVNTLKSSVHVTWFLKSVIACPGTWTLSSGQHHVKQQFRAFKTCMMQVKHKHKPG